jgi:hypothetical protein
MSCSSCLPVLQCLDSQSRKVANYDYEGRSQIGIVTIYDGDFDGDPSCPSSPLTMGEAAKKRCAAEAKAARKAKNDVEQATQPAANIPTSVDPISSSKPLNSSDS